MVANVPLADGAEHGIRDGVCEHIGVAVAIQPLAMRNLDSAENQRAALKRSDAHRIRFP